MFMTALSGAGLIHTDPEQERDPPPAATPLSFPRPDEYTTTAWDEPKLQSLFSRVLKPSDISTSHLEALNIRLSAPEPPDALLPLDAEGVSYFPPLTPSQAVNAASYANAIKLEAGSTTKRKHFDERLTELRIDNDTGYRTINRAMKPGMRPARLAHMRKFWAGLETMSQYWDTTMDQYYEYSPPPSESPESAEQAAKRQRLDSVEPNNLTVPILDNIAKEAHSDHSENSDNAQGIDETQRVASEVPLPDQSVMGVDGISKATTAKPDPAKNMRYKGRRTHGGRDMPDQFRTDTIRAFVEGTVWAFGCAVAAPRSIPILQMNKLNLPVRQTAAIYRQPKERSKARSGVLEGPLITIQVRPETDFEGTKMSAQQKINKSRLDIMRELGGLLQCAQERNRQGRTEVRPGEGKWWTEKPRWGGGEGSDVEAQEGNADIPVRDVLQMAEDMLGAARERASKPARPAKRKTPAMLWKELRCGSKMWDPKIDWEAIGKDPSSDYDEVFMISSINHHISIVKITVHAAYTDYIRLEQPPDPIPSDSNWCSPLLQRTQWFDLFDVEDRVQAFRALWGITSYLMRDK